MIRQIIGAALLSWMLISAPAISAADEGMYPISEILKLDLRSKGLQIDPAEI